MPAASTVTRKVASASIHRHAKYKKLAAATADMSAVASTHLWSFITP